MFSGCASLEELDISRLSTGKVTSMSNLFSECYKINKVTLGSDFTTWKEDALLRKGVWTNGTDYLTEQNLMREYPNKASEWAGIWEYNPSITLASSSLYLQGRVGVNFKLNIPEELLNEDTFIEITHLRKDNDGGNSVYTFKATDGKIDGTSIVFTVFEHVKELYDDLSIRAYDSNGNDIRTLTSKGADVTGGYTYNVVDSYITYWKENPSDKYATMISFMENLQNYADAARINFN